MNLIHANDETFKDVVKEGVVLVDLYADWCGPCKMLGPIIEDIAREQDKVKVVKVNVDESNETAREYGVMSIPTLLLFKDGNVIKRQTGMLPKEMLLNFINE